MAGFILLFVSSHKLTNILKNSIKHPECIYIYIKNPKTLSYLCLVKGSGEKEKNVIIIAISWVIIPFNFPLDIGSMQHCPSG